MSQLIGYLSFMPMLGYFNSMVGHEFHTGVYLTLLYFILLFATPNSFYNSYMNTLKNFGYAVSSFLIILVTSQQVEYSELIILMACVVRFSCMCHYEYNILNEHVAEFITFVVYAYACYFNNSMMFHAYVACLFAHTLYLSVHIVSDLNQISEFFQLGFTVPDTDTNKHLAVWAVIKMWYIYHSIFGVESMRDSILASFHIAMGIIHFLNFVTNIFNTEYSIATDSSVYFFSIVFIILFFTNPSVMFKLIFKIIMFVSFVIYIYFCDYNSPFNATRIRFMLDTVFLWALFCNITK